MTTLARFKTDLIEGMDKRRADAQVIVDQVAPDLAVHNDSDWTAKDLITHLTAFEEDMVDAIQAFINGEKYRLDLQGNSNIDDFNNHRRDQRADTTWEEALNAWQSARDQLRGLIVAFPDDEL